MKSSLYNLRLYKFDVPCESDMGVIIVSCGNYSMGKGFQLTQYTGRRRRSGSKAGLSKSFVKLVSEYVNMRPNCSNVSSQIFDYIVANLSFKDLEIVPPACPVLVFHIQIRRYGEDHVQQMDMTALTRCVLTLLRTSDSVLTAEDAITRVVPIAPPTTEILDCYQSPDELCCLCGKGYPKEAEIVYRTKCNHIFHATCISRYLSRTPQCPVCFAQLSPVDIRTLLFL